MSMIRISIGNLAPRLRIAGSTEAEYFGLLNRKALSKGTRLFTALGGAAEMTEYGKSLFEKRFSAEFQEGHDARFTIDDSMLDEALSIFASRDAAVYEINIEREIAEELCTKELPIQESPVLERSDLEHLQIKYVTSMPQALSTSKAGTSAREGDIPTRRFFNLFELVVDENLRQKIAAAQAIMMLNENEVSTTNGGASKGTAIDGSIIGDNVFLF